MRPVSGSAATRAGTGLRRAAVAAVVGLAGATAGLWLLLAPEAGDAPPTGAGKAATSSPGEPEVMLPPAGAAFDYQIGGDYPLPTGTEVVSRDWFEGSAVPTAYSICYVNAFQT